MSGSRHRLPWNWILILMLVAGLFVGSRLLPLTQWVKSFEDWVQQLGFLGAVLFAVVYVVAALLFVPGSVLTIAAGFAFGLLWGTVIVSVSSVSAAALAFLIARYTARDRVERLVKRNRNFEAIDRAIAQKGWKVVLLLRLSPLIPFSVSNYLYGLTAISFRSYLLASWVGMLPGTLLYVYLGAAGQSLGGARQKSPWEWGLLGAGLVATAAVTVLLARVARKELHQSGLQTK